MELAGAGRVLLIDRDDVGEGQTSACGTQLGVLQPLDALPALEQVNEEIVLQLPSGRVTAFRPPYPFATFDYRTLCRLLFERSDAPFLKVGVLGLTQGAVVTTRGRFRAGVLIDASGWRAVLGWSLVPGLARTDDRRLGMELSLPTRGGAPLLGPAEPAGVRHRLGLPGRRAQPHRRRLLSRRGPVERGAGGGDRRHGGRGQAAGGVFPSCLRPPVAGEVFLVGDGGQRLPLSGEGIRPALVFGQLAGRLARRVIGGELGLADALAAYRRFVLLRAPAYGFLEAVQHGLLPTSRWALPIACWPFHTRPFTWLFQAAYWWAAPPRPAADRRRVRAGAVSVEDAS